MQIIRAKDFDDMSHKAANLIFSQVTMKNNSVLGLATGGTVEGVYKRLVELYKWGEISFKNINTVNLDEYVGLAPDHDQSYRYYMDNHFFNHVDIPKGNTNVPNGLAKDIAEECRRYEANINALGGIDLQLLGVGPNGHVAFNEPDSFFPKVTHQETLTESTITANSRFFESRDEVPTKALTMGIGSIMRARKLLLCAEGSHKAAILEKVLTGPVTPEVPGSIIQLHPDVVVIADEKALAWLK